MTETINTLLKRLELIKDSDPFNKRILNDCYDTIKELNQRLETLENTLENVYESVGTEQKL
jgi:tetrahydromethanopterin S-methyltransferase subunit G